MTETFIWFRCGGIVRTANFDSYAIDSQKQRALEFVKNMGLTESVCYTDNGAKGATLDRPGMNALVNDIKNGEVEIVVVINFSRLCRGNSLLFELKKFTDEHKVKVISVQEGELSGSPFFTLPASREVLK